MEERIHLPEPSLRGSVSVEEAIKNRRTVRSFAQTPLSLEMVSQILWAAQGVTGDKINFRSVPSAGIIYPLDVYLVVGQNAVEGLREGIYRYSPEAHSVERLSDGDRRAEIAEASFGQLWMAEAPILIVIAAEFERLQERYGERAIRYAELEAGHAGQNVFLQAEARGLAAGIVGVSNAPEVLRILSAVDHVEPLSVMPVGHRN